MTIRMTATELKAGILAVLDQVRHGAEVEITKRGSVVARLVPPAGPHALRGRLTGTARTAGEEESLFSTGQTWHAS